MQKKKNNKTHVRFWPGILNPPLSPLSLRGDERGVTGQAGVTLRLIMFTIIILSLSIFIPAIVFASTAEEDVRRIQESYSKIKDIRGSFVQKSYIKDFNRTDTYKGSLFIKMPSKMRWEYKGEKPQEIIINSGRIIIYKKAEKQAYKGIFNKQTYGQAPVALLSGFGNISEEFEVKKTGERLLLTPRFASSIVSIEVETSDSGFPIKSFLIKDVRRNRIEIILKDIEMNTGLKESLFDLSIPEGAGVYEYNP